MTKKKRIDEKWPKPVLDVRKVGAVVVVVAYPVWSGAPLADGYSSHGESMGYGGPVPETHRRHHPRTGNSSFVCSNAGRP